jgi:ketosteroid isomerase-like protein
MSFLAEDAIYLYSPYFVKIGKKEWGPWLDEAFSRAEFELNWEAVRVEVGPSADMGYTAGDWRATWKDSEGKPNEVTGSYLAVWERQDDGEWKVIAESEYSGKTLFELHETRIE